MKTIDAHELNDIMEREDDWVLLDVLPREHYEDEHVPGANNIPLDGGGFIDQVRGVTESPDDKVIVYCANTECELSPQAARALEDAGYTNVLDFEGGVEEWKSAGYEVASEIHEPLGS